MGDIAQRGNRLTKGVPDELGALARGLRPGKRTFKTHGRDVPTMAAKGGRIGKFGGGRTNLLEELGRVEAEPSNRNRRAEISRVHGELNRGYAIGGVVKALKRAIPKPKGPKKPKSRDSETHGKDVRTMAAKGGRIGLKKGGSDKKWMQKVSASIKKRGTKGKCTPITKPGCTGRAKALAKTFKKIAAKNKKA